MCLAVMLCKKGYWFPDDEVGHSLISLFVEADGCIKPSPI